MSQQQQQQQTEPAEPIVDMADLSQCKSSYTSTGLPADTGIVAIDTTAEQHYPVDEITQLTSCALQTCSKNLRFTVAYGSAMSSTPGEVYHGQEISAGYAKVGVKEVCNDWKNLELDIPGGDGETTLADAVYGYILWDKRYIILKPIDQGSRPASPQPAHRSPPPPPSLGPAPEHSHACSSPRQPSTTPAEPPAPGSPPPPPPKKRKKTEPENKDKPLDPSKLNFFIGMKESNRRKFIEKPPLSDYDRSIKKSYDKRKSGSSSSDVPQLGAQQKQAIEPLVVLNQEHQGFLGFL